MCFIFYVVYGVAMKRVGPYTLGDVIGKGAFGVVRLAVHEESDMTYAVKILSLKMIKDKKLTVNVKREISTMKSLRHDHIVQLHSVLKSSEELYLVCDLVTGGELFDLVVEKGHLSEREARRYFAQIIDAVSFCHSQGIVHRDLKVDNLLLTNNDDGTHDVKIADFGLANVLKEDELLQTVCGTPGYAAPEVLRCRGYDGRTADIWSCGVVLYVMLAGCLPFEEAALTTLLYKADRADYEMPEVSDPAADLIRHILIANPLKRFTAVDISEHEWMKGTCSVESHPSVSLAPIAEEQEEEEAVVLHPASSKALLAAQSSMRLEFLETTTPPPVAFDHICSALERMCFRLRRSEAQEKYKVKAVKGDTALTVRLNEGPEKHTIQIRPARVMDMSAFMEEFKRQLRRIL